MEIDKTLLILLISILAIFYMIYKNVTKDLTVQSYVTTNYMYVFTALLIIIFTNYTMESIGVDIMDLYNRTIPLMLLLFGTLFGILLYPKENQTTKHMFWLGFIILNSILLYPAYKIGKNDNIIWKTLSAIGVMFLSMSYIAHIQPSYTFDKWTPYLFIALFGLLVFRILDLLFGDIGSNSFNKRSWWFSIVSLIVFNLYLIYDTQKIIADGDLLSKSCKGKDHMSCADYPSKSVGLLLDIMNIFTNLTNVLRKKINFD